MPSACKTGIKWLNKLGITERKVTKNSVLILAEINVVKLKAAELSRFLSQISAKFFNIGQTEVNFSITYFPRKTYRFSWGLLVYCFQEHVEINVHSFSC